MSFKWKEGDFVMVKRGDFFGSPATVWENCSQSSSEDEDGETVDVEVRMLETGQRVFFPNSSLQEFTEDLKQQMVIKTAEFTKGLRQFSRHFSDAKEPKADCGHLKAGDFVFLKRNNFPDWPATVIDGAVAEGEVRVSFYPERDTGIVSRKSLVPSSSSKIELLWKRLTSFEKVLKTLVAKYSEREIEKTRDEATKVVVDYENTGLPKVLEAKGFYQNIEDGLNRNGFSGKVDVTVVVGYVDHIPDEREAILEQNNVTVLHAKKIPRPAEGSTNDQSADKKIVEILKEWLEEGLPPQNVLVATGDNGFADVFKLLRAAGHTVVFATLQDPAKTKVSSVALEATSLLRLVWNDLLVAPSQKSKAAKRAQEGSGMEGSGKRGRGRGRGR